MFTTDDIVVSALPGERYPVQVELFLPQPESDTEPTLYKDFGLTVEEARELAKQLNQAANVVEDALTFYVQVRFENGAGWRRYTYIDPSASLRIGDKALVDTTYGDNQVVEVVALGKGDYAGPYKELKGRVETFA